ncbi:hypothetical protein KVV02_003885 [Mortierella alpina]|uniref:Uncharacterized protein n=1 Tax=Mortierella alpina TaxID=64518 RepID=A0A9P8A2F7_MORAP|nr:hypothetical protein KVV02_003885 [Mortierella alpina]
MATKDQKTCDCSDKNRREWDLHPLTNRTHENADSHTHHSQHHQTQAQAQAATTTGAPIGSTCVCGKKEWDLHPATIRKIENEGSASDVKDLHDLERHCERAEHKHSA